MVLRMQNFSILGVHWKSDFKAGGGSQKTIIEGGDCIKRGGAWTVCWFKQGCLASKRDKGGGRGGECWDPNAHFYPTSSIFKCLNYQSISLIVFLKFSVIYSEKTFNYTFGSMKVCWKDIFPFLGFTRLTILEFQIVFLCLINVYMLFASIQSSELVDSFKEPVVSCILFWGLTWNFMFII